MTIFLIILQFSFIIPLSCHDYEMSKESNNSIDWDGQYNGRNGNDPDMKKSCYHKLPKYLLKQEDDDHIVYYVGHTLTSNLTSRNIGSYLYGKSMDEISNYGFTFNGASFKFSNAFHESKEMKTCNRTWEDLTSRYKKIRSLKFSNGDKPKELWWQCQSDSICCDWTCCEKDVKTSAMKDEDESKEEKKEMKGMETWMIIAIIAGVIIIIVIIIVAVVCYRRKKAKKSESSDDNKSVGATKSQKGTSTTQDQRSLHKVAPYGTAQSTTPNKAFTAPEITPTKPPPQPSKVPQGYYIPPRPGTKPQPGAPPPPPTYEGYDGFSPMPIYDSAE